MRADIWGPAGAAVAAACCLGFAPVVTALTAVGLGSLLHDAILVPLLGIFLGLTLWQLARDRGRHGHAGPLALSTPGAALTLAGIWISSVVVALALASVFGAAMWNLWLVWRLRRTSEEEGP